MSLSDFNTAKLTPFIQSVAPDFGDLTTARSAGSGQSNPTFILADDQGSELVLRRKPTGKLLPSAHAIDREYRVMHALADSKIPVPKMLGYCNDLGILGVEFYLMERVHGVSVMDPRMPDQSAEIRTSYYQEMAHVLGNLHAIDLAAHALSDFGAPGSYFERGVGRWTKQYRAAQTKDLQLVDDLISWLDTNQPSGPQETTLVHGDYRIDNLLITESSPHIQAVLDWELSTTGHPMSDLGSVLMQWSLPPGAEGRGLAGVDRAALGIPSDEAFIDAYLDARGGGDLTDLKFATAFAFFRMASILQGVVRRGLDGNASDPEGSLRMAPYVEMFAAGGLQVAAKS